MNAVAELFGTVATDVVDTFRENWPYLLVGIVVAAAMRTYVGSDRIAGFLRGRTWITVIAAVALATFTPFCSCGTEAVVLSLMAGSVPWAPIVAFMVASPLTSPEELVMSGGLFGWPFAVTYFVGATLLGLAAGFLTAWIERRGWLVGQARMAFADAEDTRVDAADPGSDCCAPAPRSAGLTGFLAAPTAALRAALPTLGRPAVDRPGATLQADCCTVVEVDEAAGCCAPAPVLVALGTPGAQEDVDSGCCAPPTSTASGDAAPGQAVASATAVAPASLGERLRLRVLSRNLWAVGRRILVFFFAFSALGYLLIRLLPTSLFSGFLGGSSAWAVLVMALVGIPLYITTDGSLPLVASLLHSGMSQGAAMAFLVTGAGTSLGAIAGALLIARGRVVGLVIAILFTGALIMGYGTQLVLDR